MFTPAGGRSVLCSGCSAKADVIIRTMVRQGHLTKTIAAVVKLTTRGVDQRRYKMGLKQVGRSKLIRSPFLIGEVKSKPPIVPAPVKPVCQWPSGPGREMHICCRPRTYGLSCDADAA